MKSILKKVLIWMLWPAYVKQGGVIHPLKSMIVCFIVQKIFRVNSHVPWPVHFTSKILAPKNIQRGSRTPGYGVCSHIDGRNGIELGENVWLGPRVSIISMNHNVNNYDVYEKAKPVRILRDSWLAANSVILPGVTLGPHTIVAAGAVVTTSFPEGNQVLAGIPAKIIKKLEPYVNSEDSNEVID